MRTLLVGIVSSLVALVGFASTANASATIDLLWAGGGGTNTTIATSSSVVLNIVLTNDVNNIGGSVSVDYSGAAGNYTVAGFTNNPGNPTYLPLTLGPTSDMGGLIESFNAGALPPYVGAGLPGGQSYLLGTITFHKSGPGVPGALPVSVVLGINDSIASGTGAGTLPASQITLGTATLTNVPEPGTLTLLALGLSGIALAGRRR